MYNAQTLKQELIGLVGWRQNPDSAGWQLTEMTSSSSGLWFNGVHPMLSIDNLISICPRFDLIDSDQVATNTAFTNWLQEKTEDAILKAIEAWIDAKFENKTTNNLLNRTDLFDVTGNITDLELSSGDVVGIEVTPSRQKSMTVGINKIGVQLDTNQILSVHLFKSGQVAPVQTVNIDYQGAGSVQWELVNWSLKGEGSYWIAYDQRTLTGNAINGVRDYTFNSRGLTSFPSGRFFSAIAFNAAIANVNDLWDLSKNDFTISTNYGLNFSMDVRCDYTDFIVDQKDLFKTLISLQVGMDLLREIAFNPQSRVNRNEANVTRSQLLYEIDGDTQGRNDFSVLGRYKKALGAIQFDTTGIDKTCLPCRRRAIRHKAIGPR